jgi:hypothetical protein
MPFCTIVEFEWDESFDHESFGRAVGGTDGALPSGCLSRIASIDAAGARMIEVWQSGADAQAFAEQSAPLLASTPMPPPARVAGFELTSYQVA